MINLWGTLSVGMAVVVFLTTAMPAAAQTPTPWPTPTPVVTDSYVLLPTLTYGEGGIILAVCLVAGCSLISMLMRATEKLVEQ